MYEFLHRVVQTMPSRDFCGTDALTLITKITRRGWHARKVPQARMRVAPNSAELLERSVRALWEHANPNRIAAVPIPAMSRSVTDIGGRNPTGPEVDMKWPAFAVTLAAVASIGTATLAQDAWPTKAVVVVVPFAAGGNTDVLARIFAE